MEAKIKLNDEQLNKAMQSALLEKIDGISRDNIIAQSIEFLTTPQKSTMGEKDETPLMKAFNRALNGVLDTIVREEVSKKESVFRVKIEELVADGVKKWLKNVTDGENKQDSFPSKIADAIEKALIPKGSYY